MSLCSISAQRGPAMVRSSRISPAGALGASLGEEPADIDRHMLGIADEVVANPIGGLRCLGEQMQPIGFAEQIGAKRIARKRAQDHQRRHPLPVRRAFIDLVACDRRR